MSEITIYPETIKDQSADVIDEIGFAIEHALTEYDEEPDVLWGAMYLRKGKVEFRCDFHMDYTLEEYENALRKNGFFK